MLLYINQFRGFNDTYLYLNKTNFLVGENSTGKTTLLSLIKLLSTREFWHTLHFNMQDIELGYGSEIISHQATTAFFEIAAFDTLTTNTSAIIAYYLRFQLENNEPRLIQYCFQAHQNNFMVAIQKEQYQYTIQTTTNEIDSLYTFKQWVEEVREHKAVQEKNLTPMPLFLLHSALLAKTNTTLPYNEMILPIFLNDLTWIAPIRTKPQRIYENYKLNFTPEGEHTPYLLQLLLNNGEFQTLIEKFGADSGLFEQIQIKPLNNEKNAPFEIHITLNDKPLKITNVGYGISQILPILVETIARKSTTCFAIQQPEVHIHPKGQAAMGELLYYLSQHDNKSFIIETHSDFIIDRYRLLLRKQHRHQNLTTSDAQVLFFERTASGNQIHIIPIDTQGDYADNTPPSFKDFFIKEELALLSY